LGVLQTLYSELNSALAPYLVLRKSISTMSPFFTPALYL
jgi:hypothetical protein